MEKLSVTRGASWDEFYSRFGSRQELSQTPSPFVEICLPLVSMQAKVLELGPGFGGDAITFAKERRCSVVGVDCSQVALSYLQRAVRENGLESSVRLIAALAEELPANGGHPDVRERSPFDVIFARMALHFPDSDLFRLFDWVINGKILRPDGWVMVQGKSVTDEKIAASSPLGNGLFQGADGYARRAWNRKTIDKFANRYSLCLIGVGETTETSWGGNRADLIHFIAQRTE